MSTYTAMPSIRVRIIGRTGLGLTAIALCLAGAFFAKDAFDRGRLSPAAGVTWGVVWVVATVASAAVLTSGTSHRTRAIDIRRGTLVYFLISFGLLSIGWRGRPVGAVEVVDQAIVPAALLVVQAAIAAWAVGFRFLRLTLLSTVMSSTRSMVAPPGLWRLRSPYVPILLYLASAASTAYRLHAGTFAYLADANSLIQSPGSLGPVLQFGENLGDAAIVVAAIGVLLAEKNRFRPLMIFAVLTLAELGVGAFSGTKTPFILLAIAVAIPFFANQRRVSWKVVAAGVAVLAIGTSFNGSYRERLVEQGGRLQGQQALGAFTDTAFQTIQPAALAKAVGDGTQALGPRLRQIDNVTVVVQRTPSEIPYRPTQNLILDSARNVIPRALWPGKPSVTTGLDFSRDYYKLPTNVLTASAITVIGDLYRHGGIVVVIVGMCILGAAVRLLDDSWHPVRDIRLGILYVSVFLTLVNLELDVSSLIVSIPVAVLSSVIASKIAYTRSVSTES